MSEYVILRDALGNQYRQRVTTAGADVIPHVFVDASVAPSAQPVKPAPGETFPVAENGAALTALQALAATIASARVGVSVAAAVQTALDVIATASVLLGTTVASGRVAVSVATAVQTALDAINTALAPPSSGFSGQFTVTTAGTSVQLNGGTSQALKDGIEVVCDALSAGHLLMRWATGSGATNGRRVYPGLSAYVAIDNVNKVWIDASANASTGSWSAS
jgi:hypothetical protein